MADPDVLTRPNQTVGEKSSYELTERDIRAIYESQGFTQEEIDKIRMYQTQMESIYEAEGKIQESEVEGSEWTWSDARFEAPLSRSGILGMPYQFNEWADPRVGSSGNLGRVYRENIVANIPLVIFKVGEPRFMDTAAIIEGLQARKNRDTMAKIMAIFEDENRDEILRRFQGTGVFNSTRYYDFKDAYLQYTDYVNTMCRYTAIRMGIGNVYNPALRSDYASMNVRNLRNSSFAGRATGEENYVAFYADVSTSFNEGGSNETGESMMASGLKNIGGIKREADFLFGAGGSNKIEQMSTASYNETVKSLTDTLGDPTGLLSRITTAGQTILSGGNVLFPEIWKESSYRKSYTINLRFYSPYGDPESIFLNVYVPLFHCLAMAMPRQNSRQGYLGPFIIKMYSKGWFNCDLGMVDSIEIKKGGNNGDWTISRFPMEVEVTLNVKDLYPVIMLTMAKGAAGMFMNNTALVEHLKLMAGLELHNLYIFDNISSTLSMLKGQIENIPEKAAEIGLFTISKGVQRIAKSWLGG